MVTSKKDFDMRIYPNAAHAFFNDTTPMYNEAAARDTWERVLRNMSYKRNLRHVSTSNRRCLSIACSSGLH
jgi:dienelactone hydrolase